MAYDDNQNEYPIPGKDSNKRTSASLLPRYFRTDANKKFLSSTLDQYTNPGVAEKLNGFVGSRVAKATTVEDNYISEVTTDRQNYQLEPHIVKKDDLANVVFDADYLDYIGQIGAFGGNTKNHSLLNEQEFYAWDPHIDFDKFSNFRDYYWLPNGPQSVPVRGQGIDVVSTYKVTLATDDDNTAFVFTPDGNTRNPKLKLYRGQTYRFEVDTPGHPFSIALNRNFLPGVYEDSSINISTLYTDGVEIEHDPESDLIDREDFVGEGYVEKGVLTFTVPANAPDDLYYISQYDINTSGVFNLYGIEAASEIDVETEILGKKRYTTADGWAFSNGMKVYFTGNVTPASYANGLYYVEGVGKGIQLIPVNSLSVPAIFTSDAIVPFDTNAFDTVPFGDAKSFAGSKDYIVIQRSDTSRNAWARYNRWFHKDVIETSARINNQVVNLDQAARASRPIIEFEPNLRLINHGVNAKTNVDLVDTFTTDVGSTIEGSLGYYVDGVQLVDGMRVLFLADKDTFVNGKIFTVKFITHNNRYQLSLIEADDTTPLLDETVLVESGEKNAGKMYYYDGSHWQSAQDKTGLNQAPKFDLFDEDGYSLADETYYPATEFDGNRIFSYRVGEGTNDPELGFPITYKNFVNIGDIVFDFDLLGKSYTYELAGEIVRVHSDRTYLEKNENGEQTYVTAWTKANTLSSQYVVRKYTGQDKLNDFAIDMFDKSSTLNDLTVQVYKNNDLLFETIDYNCVNVGQFKTVRLTADIGFNDIVVIKAKSKTAKNSKGYYEIPHNLERNPQNNNITEFTLGQVTDHVNGIIAEIKDFQGIAPGAKQLRDFGNEKMYGRKFVQHSGLINLAAYSIVDNTSNLIKSLRFASNEYLKFKNIFLQTAKESKFDGTVKDHVDQILNTINLDKSQGMPFYSSDMLGISGSKEVTYTVLDSRNKFYALSEVFDITALSRKAVYVYVNDVQLTYEKDYTFTNDGFVQIIADFNNDDIIKINEFESTEGNYVPITPSKIGMYPAFYPQKFMDTTYDTNTNVIRGHDGSLTKAYNDYRDDLLLELEKRIFNNIKIRYDSNYFDIHDYVPGEYRQGIDKKDLDAVMIHDFQKWMTVARLKNYTQNDFVDPNNSFTFNYSRSVSPKGNQLTGFWRSIYKHAFDTDRPNTHPWEMLGFANEPSWWEEVYGPAPYTKDNLVLWRDLENGTVREPNKALIRRRKYVRPNLTKNIPVDSNGNVVSPLDASFAQSFSYTQTSGNLFKFGDEAPTETAWRRSSSYPFSLLCAIMLNRPARTVGLGFDRSRITRNKAGNLVNKDNNKSINLATLTFPKVFDTTINLTCGLVNFVAEYMSSSVTSNYQTYIDNVQGLTNQIGFKVGGFTDKEKLKLVLDSRTPLNQGNVFVPFENYDVTLRKSSPLEVVTYSGIIVEKVGGGYRINGYDRTSPVFTYNPPIPQANDIATNVGGISETFIRWAENSTYIIGKVVEYDNRYYRVKVTHTSESTFDASKFTALNSLPVNGGKNIIIRRVFDTKKSTVDYGTVFPNYQDVIDFMLGYQYHLKQLGFVFDYFNKDTGAIENFDLSVREFGFWLTQNWATSSIITVSPLANRLQFKREGYVVGNLFEQNAGYTILDQNGRSLKKTFTNVYRDNYNEFNLSSNENGIYLVKLPLVQKEHLVLIDNTTVFNDTIYDPEVGYRQERLKVVGYRTDGWNGSLNIPGFVYDEAKVTEWESWKDYAIGDLVKYKQFYYAANIKHAGKEVFDDTDWNRLDERPVPSLQANFDYKANQFTDFYDLDTDNFDSEQQRLAQHLIGYQKRQYLENIIQDDISQYKFYQGFIQEKGTNNALTKLFDKLGSADKDSLEFYEEWAIRTAQYGALEKFDEVEYQLDESQFRIEPQLVELVRTVDTTRTDLVYQYTDNDVYVKPKIYNHSSLPTMYSTEEYTKTGGYVKLDQIDFIATTKEDLLNLSIDSVDVGMHVWIPKEKQSWNVYKHAISEVNVISIERIDNGFTAKFDKPVNFAIGDIIGINNVSDELNNFWLIQDVALDTVEIYTEDEISQSFIDLSDSTLGVVTELVSRRVASVDEINALVKKYNINDGDRIWLDDNGYGKFETLDNKHAFDESTEYFDPTDENIDNFGFGSAIAVNKNNNIMVVGSPDNDNGVAHVYTRAAEGQTYTRAQLLTPFERKFSIDTISQTNPTIVTTLGAHGLEDGALIYISGIASGNDYSALNERFYIVGVTGETTIELYEEDTSVSIDSSAFENWDDSFGGEVKINIGYTEGKFGSSVSITPDGQYLFIGAPTASNVRTRFVGAIDETQTYQEGDIVSQRNTLWRAKRTINQDSSTININSQDWELVEMLSVDTTGESLGLDSQGVVHVFKKQLDNSFKQIDVICSLDPADSEQFGIAQKVVSTTDFKHSLYIKSLADNGRIYFIENKQAQSDSFVYSKDTNYKGEFSEIYKYVEGEIVYYEDYLYRATTTIPAGSPWDIAQWEALSTDVDYVGFVPNVGEDDLLDEDSSGFGAAQDVADSFAISANGDVFVMTGFLNATDEYRVSVYRKVNGRYVFDQNIDALDSDENFAHSIAIEEDGKRLVVGAQRSEDYGKMNGKVYVYTLQNNEFALDQELYAPDGEKDNYFGNKVSISNNKLAVYSINGDTVADVTFDEGDTSFDNKATTYSDTEKNNGQVYIFEKRNNKYIYAENMRYARDTETASEPFVLLNNNHYYYVMKDLTNGTNYGCIVDFRADKDTTAWTTNSVGEDFINTEKLKGIFLYNRVNNDLITYLEHVDPIQGRILGAAEQELSYKLYYDPAVFNIGSTDTGSTNVWTNDYVGKLWWDLSAVRWYNPYQGNTEFKANTWNKVIPGFEVAVYEWVQSDYLPSEWDELSGTPEGDALGISGQTKYSDDTYSSAKIYDPVSGSFSDKYYFWVNNVNVLPNVDNRKITASEVSNLIEDPAGNGYRFISIVDDKSFALHNIKSLVKDKDTILHIDYDIFEDTVNKPIHTEYELLTEGLASSKPSENIVDKWIASLVGYDTNGIQIPDISVPIARRYGILNDPIQSMFVNKTEAVKQVVERVNNVFRQNLIVDDFDVSELQRKDPYPSKYEGIYDTKIESEDLLRFVGTAKLEQASLTATVVDGVITAVEIVNPGRGYIDPSYTSGSTRIGPSVEIVGSGTGAEIKTYINSAGVITSVEIINGGKNYKTATLIVRPFTALIESDSSFAGFWTTYTYNKASASWQRQLIQSYDVNKYWQYIDWYAPGYDVNTSINHIVPGSFALSELRAAIGEVVKVETIGSGGWLLLHKIDNQENVDYTVNYQTIGRQNGTIQLSKLLYNSVDSGFDNQVYDSVLYDREPIDETRIILRALESSLFVDQLEVEWNKLFFASLRYALAEQQNLDWAFKTSFVTAKHNVGELEQKVTYQNDNLPNYQDYVHEVKPYSTKIREYISSYEKVDPTQTSVTDFDLPTRYDPQAGRIIGETVRIINNTLVDTNTGLFTYPQKHWTDNLGFEITDFVIFEAGFGYTDTASVTVSGGGGPTLTGLASRAGSGISFIDVDTTGARYTSAPTVTITGSLEENGTEAKAYAILGNSKARSSHLRIKFDRISGETYFETLDEIATFTGTGSATEFNLKFPIDTTRANITVSIDDVEALSASYTPSNTLDTTKGYDRYLGKITFATAPSKDTVIKINYKKATSLLHAADRIIHKYVPGDNMPGKELSQLMDGVEYDGVQLDTIGFGTLTGWDSDVYGVYFDTFDENYEDEVFILDGSTSSITLSKPLEAGVTYNVYKGRIGANGAVTDQIRIDDENYPSTTVNKNAVMLPLLGDGVTDEFIIDNDKIQTAAQDVIIIRKSTSDGSFETGNTVYDVELSGGTFATATGLDAGEIVVDGDGFVTETTSKGPEEQVPGQVLDAMDLKVYNLVSDGTGIISTRNYITDGVTIEYEFDTFPKSTTNMIIKLDSFIYDPDQYQVDWENKTVSLADSTPFPADSNLSITSIGSNGIDIVDTDKLVADGINREFATNIRFKNDSSAYVTLDGVFQQQGVGAGSDYNLKETDTGFIAFEFGNIPTKGQTINYTIYDGAVDKFSAMQTDDSFIADGVNKIHRFTGDVSLPKKELPISHRILVNVSSKILNPGYSKTYTLTSSRTYDIDAWQFEDTTKVRNSDVFVYIDGKLITNNDYDYDPINGRVNLLKYNVGLAGQVMDILIIRDAEYYFFDTVVKITDPNNEINTYEVDDIIEFKSTDDSTVISATVETFSRTNDVVTIKLQGYERELAHLLSIDDTPPIIASSQVDSSVPQDAKITSVEFVQSNNLTFATPPAEEARVRIYTFSNHDINEFNRTTYDVVYKTSQAPKGTDAYVSKNMVSRGFIPLETSAIHADYVWVIRNGSLLSSNVDYKLNDEMNGIQLLSVPNPTEEIQIFQFAAKRSLPKFGYRIFKDILNRMHYKRLNQDNEYELAQPLNYFDKSIQLVDATGIQTPNRAIGQPGILFMNGERIEYYIVDGNTLRQIRRGTLGTGVPLQHSAGSVAMSQGPEETIPYKDQTKTTTFTGDGSTTDFVLDFTPETNSNNTTDEADVFVAGRKLRKSPLQSFDKTKDQDSTDGDITLPVEYAIQDNILRLVDTPAVDIKIQVIRKTGKVWTETGKTMADSNTQIAKFIREKTISLPR